jgi:C1A family cysteine protease/predicted secreted protein
MKPIGIHANKHVAALLICVTLLLSSLLPFTNTVAAPPPDDPDHGEVKLSAKDDNRQIELKEGQVLVVGLESNPSTGYTWEIEGAKETILRQTGKIVFEPESGPPGAPALLGAPGKQILRFEAVAAGQTTLRLVYRRPWEKGAKPAKTFSLQVQGVGLFTRPKSPTPTPTAEPPLESPVLPAEQPMLGLPAYYNWCDPGNDGCTSVKDQGNCGSCWAFGTVGPLESNILIRDTATKDLSEQYLLSCNTDGWSCSGGWWAHDYHWWKKPSSEPDAGAVYEVDFPYTATNAPCNPPHPHHEKIASWTYVGSEYSVPPVNDIKQAILDYGPVAAAVCVGSAFQGYSGGIFQTNETCTGYVNHAVVLVGWDDDYQGTGIGTWRLRNSWGSSWGEGGYMNIKYGTSNVGYAANYIIYSGGGCPDTYEPDNASTSAKWITVNGASQTHNFHAAADVDWAKFSVTAGSAYTITTSNLGASNDTVLALYDTDGTTKLRDDDCGGQAASCINNWTAPVTGTYFISVSHSADQGGCTGYGYNLTAASDSSSKITELFLPLIMKGSTCNDTQVVQNGGFESGRTVWVQSSGLYYIIGPGSQGYYPHNGSWSAWFGGYDNANDRLYQTINIPANISSARLVIYLYVESEDDPDTPYDYLHVELQNASGGTLESFLWANNTMSSSYWWKGTKEWTNFSSHAGQTLRLFFQGTTDGSLITNFFVDDVTLWTYCGGLPTGAKDTGQEGWTWQKVEAPPGYMPAPYSEELRRKVQK